MLPPRMLCREHRVYSGRPIQAVLNGVCAVPFRLSALGQVERAMESKSVKERATGGILPRIMSGNRPDSQSGNGADTNPVAIWSIAAGKARSGGSSISAVQSIKLREGEHPFVCWLLALAW